MANRSESYNGPALAFLPDSPVIITGGVWCGCLGIVQYEHAKNGKGHNIYFVIVDRLGTIAVSIGDMILLTEEVMSRPDFDFNDPQIMIAENNLRYKRSFLIHAQSMFDEAEKQLEICKDGGFFDNVAAQR